MGESIASAIASVGSGISSTFRSKSAAFDVFPGDHETENLALYNEVQSLYATSPHSSLDLNRFVAHLVIEARDRSEEDSSTSILVSLGDITAELMVQEGLWGEPDIAWSKDLSPDEVFVYRGLLKSQKAFFSNYEKNMDIWREKLIYIFAGMLKYIPENISTEDKNRSGLQQLKAKLVDVIDKPAEVIERLIATLYDDDVLDADLYQSVREQLFENVLRASGFTREQFDSTKHNLVMPTQILKETPAFIADLYLAHTPFAQLLKQRCAFQIPEESRFEHCHIVGGTGHGKTQLLKLMIHDDILASKEEPRSIVVIDSQGDLAKTISHLKLFSPKGEDNLSEKLVLIDPNDTDYPVCLNMFDMKLDRTKDLSDSEREQILNQTISLYEYMFGALLGAELTQRQEVIFKYLARLMMVIPGANVHTLRALMENSTPFKPYIEKLSGSARAFFETQFFTKKFDSTKTQILTRLWGVLSNQTLDRMFSHEQNKIDLFDAMNSGKVIVINTAVDLLQEEGCAILGRFFIALIMQSALQRASIAEDDRVPCFVYIDEAYQYFDEHIETLLNQARKYKVGMALAHQNLGQLTAKLRSTFMASTSIKIAGGVSSKDASVFSKEMNCSADFISGAQKKKRQTEFACWVKNVVPKPVRITVPLGAVDRQPKMSEADFETLRATNRERYAAPAADSEYWTEPVPAAAPEPEPEPPPRPVPPPKAKPRKEPESVQAPPPPAPKPASPEKPKPKLHVEPPLPGRGGKQHKYLQGLIKQIGESVGFKSTIEGPVGGGTGHIDVSLQKGDITVACEISVTTSPEHELGNIEKCLAAGYERVMVVCPERKELKQLEASVSADIDEAELPKIAFLLPDECLSYLEQIDPGGEVGQTVKGYKVKLQYQAISDDEQRRRRDSIGKVVATAMMRMKES